MDKKTLRADMRARARALPAEYTQAADAAIAKHILSLPEYNAADTVFCFVPMPREPDITPVLRDALRSGKRLCVPRCLEEGQMALCVIHSLSELMPGAYGILEPAKDCETLSPETPDFAVIPCVSCSREGTRLGQGGGYYDRFLPRFHGTAAMVCREELLCESIPTEEHDRNIPLVVTENGIFYGGTPRF